MKREYSAGGIVLRQAQDKLSWKVLLIKNAALRDPKKAYWGFPKGHIDPGESSRDAALREVKEETKITAEIMGKLGESQYVFTRSGERIVKHVDYYLLKYKSGDEEAQELEVLEVRWFDPKEAMELLSFKKDQEFLQRALKMIDGRW
jgi:8-oxo-dGTP pyrophosphatase MutT (NUDIX family)